MSDSNHWQDETEFYLIKDSLEQRPLAPSESLNLSKFTNDKLERYYRRDHGNREW
jgi:hypothetical protein